MIKKIIFISTIIGINFLNADIYIGKGSFIANSKDSSCQKALQYAKVDAMEKAGSSIFSSFQSTISDRNGVINSNDKSQLLSTTSGFIKLKDKIEKIKLEDNYQFQCSVKARFEIDVDDLKEKAKQKNVVDSYFIADGYSEEGQSRYRAFTSATAIAQRNLLEKIQGVDIKSFVDIDEGLIKSDKIVKTLHKILYGATIVIKEYDNSTRSAYVQIKIKKKMINKALKAIYPRKKSK